MIVGRIIIPSRIDAVSMLLAAAAEDVRAPAGTITTSAEKAVYYRRDAGQQVDGTASECGTAAVGQ